jgi:hypothetical protein
MNTKSDRTRLNNNTTTLRHPSAPLQSGQEHNQARMCGEYTSGRGGGNATPLPSSFPKPGSVMIWEP